MNFIGKRRDDVVKTVLLYGILQTIKRVNEKKRELFQAERNFWC